ncbi:MAG: cob(I)yrinic acid a,c-diamide adenosyltransferase [Ruthenibacterium sp.]
MRQGLVHLYWGDGKGKTTAAMGLAVRALGAGWRVTVVQFLKNGQSAELASLQKLGASVYSGKADTKFTVYMTDAERAAASVLHTQLLQQALAKPCVLLILDEACAVWQLAMVEPDVLKRAVLERPAGREVVLTGRDPADWMRAAADYSTEMRCCKHPYDTGAIARKGVEF